jgi:cell pole-organizing protein PopZ
MAEQDSDNILQEVQDIMSQNTLELPRTLEQSNKNIDDGTVLNLNNKVTQELDDTEKKAPSLSGLSPIKEPYEQENREEKHTAPPFDDDKHFIDEITTDETIEHQVTSDEDNIDNNNEDSIVSYDQSDDNDDAQNNEEHSEDWQSSIKEELKEFDQPHGDNSTKRADEGNVDLDKDFGLDTPALSQAAQLGGSEVLQQPQYDDSHSNNLNNKKVAPDNKNDESIISEKIYTDSKNMIDDLKNTLQIQSEMELSQDKENIEEFMVKMLKPMLKEWLDGNLPQIVKKIVQQEIKKIVK